MPTSKIGTCQIDYSDAGTGRVVVLLHSAASSNRQWRALTEELVDHYRVIAINLFGYGETSPWPNAAPQSLHSQACLVRAVCEDIGGEINLVGHSLGGSVALKAAYLLENKVQSLIMFEPNIFSLLRHENRTDAFLEANKLRECISSFGSLSSWELVASEFVDYWLGEGAWAKMPEKGRNSFIASLPPTLFESHAIFEEEATIDVWKSISKPTLLMSAKGARRPIREIVEVFADACPNWTFKSFPKGGHMAPLTHPQLVNPCIREFLDSVAK